MAQPASRRDFRHLAIEDKVDKEKVREIEEKIADLKARWPAHSVPPSMWQQLEELEEDLEEAQKTEGSGSEQIEQG